MTQSNLFSKTTAVGASALALVLILAGCGTVVPQQTNSNAMTSTKTDTTTPTADSNMMGVAMKDGKMMTVWAENKTQMMGTDMMMGDIKVMTSGKVMMKDGSTMMMKDGQMMDKMGKVSMMADDKMMGVAMKDGKMMTVWEGNQMQMMDSDMTMGDIKVMMDGKVMMKDGKSMMMQDGQMMDKMGKVSMMNQDMMGVMVGGSLMVASQTIVGNAMKANNLTTLVAAVKAGGLVDTLNGAGPFTVFAPTNAAFDKLPAGTVESLLKPENKSKLVNILTYHVVAGKWLAKDLKDGMKLKTVQGEELMVKVQDGKVWINGSAMVETADVVDSNGVSHVIDTVLMPK